MRISTRLILAIVAPALMGMIVIVLLAFSYQSTHVSQQNGTRVREIRDSITNLNSYVYSYLLYPEVRPQEQFAADYATLTQLIAGIQINNPDQQALLENIRQSSTSMNGIFLQLESFYGTAGQTGNNPLDLAAEARLQGNLLIKSRDTDINASLLKKSLDDEISTAQTRNIALIIIVVLVLIIPLTVFLFRMRKHITSSLTQLHVGTQAVGAGNLNYRMNLPLRDELGDLARSFDGMTEKLKTITVSKDALQGEVEQRKKAELALEETRDYLNNLINYANAPIIVWDPTLRITQFNHAFERLTGRTAAEVIGNCLDILFPAESRAESLAQVRRSTAGERMEVEEIPILQKNGSVRIVLWNSATLYDRANKSPVATIAQGQDITERKAAEEALASYTRQLEVSNKELESFSYTVSHDLRAPLRSMDGFSQALLEDYADRLDEQGKKWLDNIRESSQRMGHLIDDILGLSRVIRTELKITKFDLSQMISSIAVQLAGSEPARHVEFVIMPGVEVVGDYNLLNLVLQNLLGNAFKFTSAQPKARIEFGLDQQDGRKVYFVRDNGAGFDVKYIDKLFKPFQRLHSDKDYPGTGIGLVTVQRIIQRHGGEVWAQGQVNKGASFYFTLGQEKDKNA